MDLSKGYIRLFRQFIDWEWFTDVNTCHLFQYCLLRANHKNTLWRGRRIEKGQFITSLRTMSIETGLSLQQIRTSLKKLTHGSTCELTHETTNQYSIITVKNYSLYQKSNTQNNTQVNTQVTTDNNLINNSNTSYINISLSNKKITKEEREILKKYVLKQKRKPDNLQAYIKTLIKNGDWVEIVNKEKQRLEQLQQKKKEQQQTEEERELTEEEQKQQEEEIKKIQEEFKKKHHLR